MSLGLKQRLNSCYSVVPPSSPVLANLPPDHFQLVQPDTADLLTRSHVKTDFDCFPSNSEFN